MKIGDKVVCIDVSFPRGYKNGWSGDSLILGRVYTIDGWCTGFRTGSLLLQINGMRSGGIDGDGYWAWRFAPLSEQGSEVHATQKRTDDGESKNFSVGETLSKQEKMEQFK